MQLEDAGRARGARQRLRAAACVLLAATTPSGVGAATAPHWQLDGSALFYGEQSRARVAEPVARITRMFADGQSLSARFALDAMTGASPTGALPTGTVQTTTSASGSTTTSSATAIPTQPFQDLRGALDLDWLRPIGTLVTTTTGFHFSHEKDYQSLGGNARLSVDLMHRLATVTVGGGYNHDGVFPVGGIPQGLADSTVARRVGTETKNVATGLLGVSRVLTRRWMIGVTASRSKEDGYLTEPYKVVSVLDPSTQRPMLQLTENRPATRTRSDVLASSVSHLERDVLYLSYRYYWDDWGVRSNTLDMKLRHELSGGTWIQPHLRAYEQTSAQFFVFGLIHGPPLPQYASADDRLGPLRTATLGATYGFQLPGHSGEFTVRGEYLYQWASGRPHIPVSQVGSRVEREDDGGEGGATGSSNSASGTSIGSVLAGYTVQF